MSNNPLNLTLRFILELAGLAAMFYWGWSGHEGVLRLMLAVGVPVVAAAFWGIFRNAEAPNPSRVIVPGWVRLLIEVAFFGGAVFLLSQTDRPNLATVFGGLVIFHYLVSYDYVILLLRGKQ